MTAVRRMLLLAALTIAAPAWALDQIVTPNTFTFAQPPNEFVFENGWRAGPITVVYETYGTLDPDGRNAILVLHGLGGTAHAAGRHTPDGPPGWWDGLIGPGKPYDTDKVLRHQPPGARGRTQRRQAGHRENGLRSAKSGQDANCFLYQSFALDAAERRVEARRLQPRLAREPR